MDQKPTVNYASQFAFLLGLMGVGMILSSLLISFVSAQVLHVPYKQALKLLNLPQNVGLSRLLNTLGAFLCFLVPAFVLARVVSKKPFSQLGFQSSISGKQFLFILVLTFTSIVLSGALGTINEWIPLPQKWYAKAKEMEEAYKASMLTMATMKTFTDYLLALLVLATAPALFEEVLFRGGFQQVFIGWTNSKWAGIMITSILFSAIHFSYFGFLPRVVLGLVLGLIFYYSKNLWLSILLHFLNNALVVTQLYAVSKQGKSIEKTVDENVPVWWGIFALIALIFLLRAFKKESNRVLAAKEQAVHSSPENIPS
jgi:membrane protease YdiL (CAAX protease family)